MILEKGNMWSVFGRTDIFMITTNPIIKKDGSVVMGRGIALQVKEAFPTLPYDFAEALYREEYRNIGEIGNYDNQDIWWFMVKDHWANKASLNIIDKSVDQLKYGFGWIKPARVDLNFPGIGNGGLNREEVLPYLYELPDNVHIWEYDCID